MKKILTFVCLLMLGVGVGNAQVHDGESAVGANLVYGSEIKSLGVGIRYQYGFLEQLRGEVGFNYFFDHDHKSWCDVNVNAHWLLNVLNERFYIYPIVGFNYTMTKFKTPAYDEQYIDADGNITNVKHPAVSEEKNHIGLNVGAGLEYELTEHWGVNLEYRHTIMRKVDQGVIGMGVNYKF